MLQLNYFHACMLVKLPLALALTFYASPKSKPLRKDCKKKLLICKSLTSFTKFLKSLSMSLNNKEKSKQFFSLIYKVIFTSSLRKLKTIQFSSYIETTNRQTNLLTHTQLLLIIIYRLIHIQLQILRNLQNITSLLCPRLKSHTLFL